MSQEHISEEWIQEWLDGGRGSFPRPVRLHLEACEPCRRLSEQYRLLYSALAEEPEWSLPVDFASRVSVKLKLRRRGGGLDTLLTLAAIIAGAAGVVWTLGPKGVLLALSSYLRPLAPLLQRLAPPIKGLVAWLNGSLPLVVAALLALLAAWAADRWISRRLTLRTSLRKSKP